MLRSFSQKNFRCFHDFAIKHLEEINLIAGKNNVGKTALLEGMFLFAGATNPELAMRINVFRGIDVFEIKPELLSETPWNSLFYNFDENARITMTGTNDDRRKRTLNMKILRKKSELVMKKVRDKGEGGYTISEAKGEYAISEVTGKFLELEYINESNQSIKSNIVIEANRLRIETPPVPIPYNAIFLASRYRINPAEDAQRYSNVEIKGQQDILLNILKLIEPKLRRLAVAVTAGVPMIFGDIGLNRLIPLPIMGEGIAKVCSLVLAIANSPKGLVFIDEIENGIHYSIMSDIWIGVAEAARCFNTQIIATTHSRECIVSAHEALSKSGRHNFLLHRLDKINGKIETTTYDRETLEAAIEAGFEVR